MFLHLNHTKDPIYFETRRFVNECYKLTKAFPLEEKYILTQQIRRAAISVHLNLAEGASRNSGAERKRFYDISRSSIVEIDAALDIAEDFNYCNKEQLINVGRSMVECFKQLSRIIKSLS
ncbi:MAG: four helix bundle protein [Chitinophagales bacterium]